MFRLGLTGGIGSGKSTVAQILTTLGAELIDADAVARRCTVSGGSAMPAIAAQFGAEFVTPVGAMDRHRMRDLVFSDPGAKQRLEAIIHPLVQQEIQRLEHAVATPCLVFDVPLLVESPHWRIRLDRVLVVDCAAETQIERVMLRNSWPRSQVEAVVQQQSPRERRLAAADWVISNDGIEITTLQSLVRELARRIGL